MLNFIDLFAGIGGFRRGLVNSNMKCILSCEIDSSARKSYAAIHNVNESEILTDVNELQKIVEKLEGTNINLVCGGFPCQPFSRSGKREGFKDKNKGNLFFATMDIIEALKPDVILLENVKGILSVGEKLKTDKDLPDIEIDKGSTFKDILYELSQRGYDVEWQIINSAHFIEQKRERVFIHARKRQSTFKRIFPLLSDEVDFLKCKDFNKEFNGLIERLKKLSGPNGEALIDSKDKFNLLKIEEGILFQKIDNKFIKYNYNAQHPFNNWGLMINGNIITARINHKLPYQSTKILKNILLDNEEIEKKYSIDILSDAEVEKQRESKAPKTWKSGNKMGRMSFPDKLDRPSRTLTANSSGRELMIIPFYLRGESRYRRLTDLEYLRLQGFSDGDYKKMLDAGISRNQIKKQAGNAVTVSVIEAIGEKLLRGEQNES